MVDVITQEKLMGLLRYDPGTGLFVWLVVRGRFARPGSPAGAEHKAKRSNSSYIRIKIDGRSYLAHRLAFLYMTGNWPVGLPDHVNMNTMDNRWMNLRESTPSQNQANRTVRKDNKTGIKGVFYIPRDKKFSSEIQVQGQQIRLGYFDTAEAAGAAYEIAATKYFGEFARTE